MPLLVTPGDDQAEFTIIKFYIFPDKAFNFLEVIMKIILYFFFLLIFPCFVFANGVAIIDAKTGNHLMLTNCSVEVNVENQVAIVTSVQQFRNRSGLNRLVKFGFPMPEDGIATSLEYKINNQWHKARFAPIPQDTTLPGGEDHIKEELKVFLGKTPFYYDVPDTVKIDSVLTIKLTYVQLLKYEFGKVHFVYPNNDSYIQLNALEKQELIFNLKSQRTIDSLYSVNQNVTSYSNQKQNAQITIVKYNYSADKDYKIDYSLNSNELGLFSLSTTIPDSLVPDKKGKGFFLFIAEPNPKQTTDVIKKVFTIIIDRSGSMWGTKMDQAKNAAGFIINNLNEGDYFNIIDFSTDVKSFKPTHVSFNFQNRDEALQYISNLYADGSTNISGSFEKAISQFTSAPEGTAKIIIFLTDGQPTAGLTYTTDILNSVNTLVQKVDKTITIFNFGIGTDVNYQLLTLLASNNNGSAEFLENDQLENRITSFYTKIRYPVLLNTKMSFNPAIITDTYPSPLPSLYKGQQLLVAGRYNEMTPVQVTLSGTAFGRDISYSYDLNLVDSSNNRYQFLTKVWAKIKIENMLIEYYKLNPNLLDAMRIKDQIIKLSLQYGVVSPFTSFSGEDPTTTGVEENKNNLDDKKIVAGDFVLLGNYPNPFNPGTHISFSINKVFYGYAEIKIYNTLGQLLRTINVLVDRSGRFEIYWNGTMDNGSVVPSGNYIYTISYANTVLAGKMCLLK